jgi:hypothetical protein
MKKSRAISDGIGVKGFYRLKLHENRDGKDVVVGDSGWHENQITNFGYSVCIIGPMVTANSSVIGYGALGTGAAPASADTALLGELGSSNARFAVAGVLTGTKSIQWTGSLNSGVYGATAAINNVGLFVNSTTRVGTIAMGNTYAVSTLQTNQSVSLTYSLTFA